jgi:hypothetical protein
VVLLYDLVRVENCVCLSHGVQVEGATWRAATRILALVGDLVQRTGDGQAQVGYSVAGRSGGQVMPCAVCTVHLKTRGMTFLVEPQNQVDDSLSVIWPQNHWYRFSRFGLKTGGFGFSYLGLKIGSSDLLIWVSKSP